jgi:hypothetical protein
MLMTPSYHVNLKGGRQQMVGSERAESQTPVVFISSTVDDLIAYRAAARDAALRSAFQPAMKEYFIASGENQPLVKCLKEVSRADVLIVIVGHRYGWVPQDQPGQRAMSITWLECEQAARNGIEILAFLVYERGEWPESAREVYGLVTAIQQNKATAELLVETQRNVAKLREFRNWLNGLVVRETFTGVADFRGKAESALRAWMNRHPQFLRAPTPPERHDDSHQYLEHLREEAGWIDIRGLQVGTGKAYRFPIQDLFIPLTTAPAQTEEAATAAPVSIGLETALAHERLVIIGDPGAGKTTFLRRIAWSFCTAALQQKGEDCTGTSSSCSFRAACNLVWPAMIVPALSTTMGWRNPNSRIEAATLSIA